MNPPISARQACGIQVLCKGSARQVSPPVMCQTATQSRQTATCQPWHDDVGVTNVKYCTPQVFFMLSEHEVHVHAGDSKSRPSQPDLGSLSKWLASRAGCPSLGRLLYNFCKALRALQICQLSSLWGCDIHINCQTGAQLCQNQCCIVTFYPWSGLSETQNILCTKVENTNGSQFQSHKKKPNEKRYLLNTHIQRPRC